MSPPLTDMRVIAVDDNEGNLELLAQILEDAGYTNLVSTRDPERVVDLCASSEPDLILLDLHMPRLSGYDVLAGLRERMLLSESLPVIVLTADMGAEARHRALSLGARDFVTKPIDETELLLRVHNHLHVRQLQRQLEDRNVALEEAVDTRTAELEQARLESLQVLARAAEYHDDETHRHTQRVGRIAALIAAALDLPERDIAAIRDAAPLHDIGKIGISAGILLKPGRLNRPERVAMMQHVTIGASILDGARSPILRVADDIVRYHHERWDGDGYLLGLRGQEIPVSARITAIADVFDALTHERPYKPAWPLERALAEISAGAGRAFEPRAARAFATLDPLELARDIVSPQDAARLA